MSQRYDQYRAPIFERSIYAVFTRLLRVPRTPPDLPERDPDEVEVLMPHRAYLWYLRSEAVVTGVPIVAITGLIGALVLYFNGPDSPTGITFLVIAAAAAVFMVLSVLFAPLRYRMYWYALGQHSMRLRNGLWTVEEVTITYDNIQDVTVTQGPLMRLFGFHTLEIKTAGGLSKKKRSNNPILMWLSVILEIGLAFTPAGGASGAFSSGAGGKKEATPTGTLLGMRDAQTIRQRIMANVRASQTAGLGDERPQIRHHIPANAVRAEHLAELAAIRDALAA